MGALRILSRTEDRRMASQQIAERRPQIRDVILRRVPSFADRLCRALLREVRR